MLKKIISNQNNVSESSEDIDKDSLLGKTFQPEDDFSIDDSFNTNSVNTETKQLVVRSMNTSKNILSNDVKVKGTIEFTNDLVIDGTIDGKVTSSGKGNLIIGENANIIGEVESRSIIVHGKVKGNISTQERCELKSSATLEGDIHATSLSIEDGAKFIGNSNVGSPGPIKSNNSSSHTSSSSNKK